MVQILQAIAILHLEGVKSSSCLEQLETAVYYLQGTFRWLRCCRCWTMLSTEGGAALPAGISRCAARWLAATQVRHCRSASWSSGAQPDRSLRQALLDALHGGGQRADVVHPGVAGPEEARLLAVAALACMTPGTRFN